MSVDVPEPHASFLRRLVEDLGRDGRCRALLAGGSLAQGGFDVQSDLDLVIVVDDDAHPRLMAERRAFAERLGDLLAAFTGEHVGEPRLLICLNGPRLLHVDLKFVRLDELGHLVERPRIVWAREPATIEAALDRAEIAWPERSAQWFEDRAWIWLHYAATKLARGELFEALGMLGFFRDQILGPMLHRRAGRPQRGVRRLETDAEATATLGRTVAGHERSEIAAALGAAITLYLGMRADAPPEAPIAGMPEMLRRFMAET